MVASSPEKKAALTSCFTDASSSGRTTRKSSFRSISPSGYPVRSSSFPVDACVRFPPPRAFPSRWRGRPSMSVSSPAFEILALRRDPQPASAGFRPMQPLGLARGNPLLHHAEEIAVRVGEDDEVFVRLAGAGMEGGAEGEEALDLGGLVVGVEVEVQPVLRHAQG